MTVEDLQHAIGAVVDGKFGPASSALLLKAFTNTAAPAANHNDKVSVASRLGCTVEAINAVASVESSGSGFDATGKPKMLFERHLFHRLTDGKWSPAIYSNAFGGGYDQNSWEKLIAACSKDPDAAFSACSWGKFQVLGMHWSKLGYASPYELAHSCVRGEGEQYELLARYVETFGLLHAIRTISANPETCREFAKLYNGPNYVKFDYHAKLARAFHA